MKIRITNGDNPIGKLFAEAPPIESEAEYQKLMIVEELLGMMKEQGITRSELAKRMGVQPSRITSMMTSSNNFTIEPLVRAGRAVGADIELHFVPMKQPAKRAKASKLTHRVAEDEKTYRAKRKAAKRK